MDRSHGPLDPATVPGGSAYGTDGHRMRDGDHGPFLPPAGRQAVVQGRPVGPLGARRGMGQLREDRPQGLLPRPNPARAWLARTRLVAWRHPGPDRQTGGGAQARPVDPGLGHPRSAPAGRPAMVSSPAMARVTVNGATGGLGSVPGSAYTDASRPSGRTTLARSAIQPWVIAALRASLCSSRTSIGASWMARKPPMRGADQPREGLLQEGDLAPPAPLRPLRPGGRRGRPSITTARIARPDTPSMSLATAANLLLGAPGPPDFSFLAGLGLLRLAHPAPVATWAAWTRQLAGVAFQQIEPRVSVLPGALQRRG